ncbi:MAG TPA: FAD-dependent oxidoreductase [Nitrososphaerales archaeon]|nr:FAD-dependent oxidoreductase [Nitrososphaerales archaeon]
MQDHDVVVIGGGSTGCSILYHLAKVGVKDALLLDMAPQVASGQTSRSTALVRTHYSTAILTRMALLSYRFFRDFGRELPGRSAGYVETGLLVGADDASVKALRENSAMHKGLGIDSRVLRPEELAKSGIEPMLDASAFSLFAYEPHAGYAEPSTTASAFASAAVELGAKVLTGTRATKIERARSKADGYRVSTTSGPIGCRKVVLATGVWSKPVFSDLGVDLPLKVSRHPVAIFGRPANYLGTRPVVFDFPRSAYYKPEGNELFFVGTLAHELDASGVDADPDAYDETITYEEAADFSSSASVAFPVMGTAGTYRQGYAGLYDNTPDQLPIIDELSDRGFPGIYCVVGLSGHGFKLAPEFGRIIASLVAEGAFSDYDVSVFKLRRFEDGRLLGGRYGVSTIL